MAPRSRMRAGSRLGVAAGLGATILTLAGCTSGPATGASDTAREFYAALSATDYQAACELLSAATRTELEQSAGKACPEALPDEDLPGSDSVDSSQVYGTMAIVAAPGDTMFLSRFPQGWLVTAVGCHQTKVADQYDCAVEGS